MFIECNAAISGEGYWTCVSGEEGTPCRECRDMAAGLGEIWDDQAEMFVMVKER